VLSTPSLLALYSLHATRKMAIIHHRAVAVGGRAAGVGVEMPLSTAATATALGLYGGVYCVLRGDGLQGPVVHETGSNQSTQHQHQHPTRNTQRTKKRTQLLGVTRFCSRWVLALGLPPGGWAYVLEERAPGSPWPPVPLASGPPPPLVSLALGPRFLPPASHLPRPYKGPWP
jgi:hypothetical protein